MNLSLNQIIKLLDIKNIKVIADEAKIYIDERLSNNIPLENHYGVSIEGGSWSYCLYLLERRNVPEIQIIKQFQFREEALNYLFLKQLNHYYMNKYVVPNRQYDEKEWNMDVVFEEAKRLSIPLNYISFEKKINANSIYFVREKELWYSGYINSKKCIIHRTQNGIDDQEWFLSLSMNKVYPLYLFDLYTKELKESGEVVQDFTDEDKLIFLGYK